MSNSETQTRNFLLSEPADTAINYSQLESVFEDLTEPLIYIY